MTGARGLDGPSRRGGVDAAGLPRSRRALLAAAALALAAALWLPTVHLLFAPTPEPEPTAGVSPFARTLAVRHLALWATPALREAEIARMRRSNAEWDFMGRTFLVLAVANMALREPPRAAEYLGVIDAVIDETVQFEREHGFRSFMMDYARHGAFQSGVDRSLFVDGELALMMGARRLVAERPDLAAPMRERVAAMVDAMGRSPALVGESYPDEG